MQLSDKGEEIAARLRALTGQQEERLAEHRAQKLGLPYVSLASFPLDSGTLALVPKAEAEALGAVVFYKKGRDVRLGAVNPGQREVADLRARLQVQLGVQPQVYVISHRGLTIALTRYVKERPARLPKDEVLISEGRLKESDAAVKSLQDLGGRISSVPPGEIVSVVLAGAVAVDASDIHIEPRRETAQLRYRVDGVLYDTAQFALEGWQRIMSRVKVLSSMKLNVRNMPQDGSFVLRIGELVYDIRVSVLPGAFGENLVMRLLSRQESETIDLKGLGMKERDLAIVHDELKKSTGMVVTAGPTGSGKTTTIVACLREINRPELKVITLEDPIEYRVAGVEQTEVDEGRGYTFSAGLRSILRQDPDIIFVGEMRDKETSVTAVQASMTGHLVFTTVHANNAPGVILRLYDMGVQPYVLAPALNLIIAQRLVRKVCPECAEEYAVPEKLRVHLQEVMRQVSEAVFDHRLLAQKNLTFVRAKGCQKCTQTGYKGRVGVFEAFAVRDEVEELILQGAPEGKIRAAALAAGMTTIAQDAYLKVIEKITTVEEVERISEE